MNWTKHIPISKFLKISVSILFGLLVFTFYLYTHPEYAEISESPPRFQFFSLLLLVYALPIIIKIIVQSKVQNFKLPIWVPILMTFIAGLYIPQYLFLKEIGYLKSADFAFYTILIASVLGGTIWIVAICWASGALLAAVNGVTQQTNLRDILIQTAKGIMVFTLVLFLLAQFKMLTNISLWIYSGVIITLSLIFRKKLFRPFMPPPLKIADFSYVHHLLIFGIVTVLTANFIEQLRPIPSGYDGMTLYANLSFLLADYQELVAGFGAYNWPLFASAGMVLFNKPEMVLMANFQIVVLALITLYVLLKSNFGQTPALLGVLLMVALPALNRMIYMQQKVEGAVLFFILILLIQIFQLLKKPNHYWLVFQIGLTAGFLIGIKPTSILLIIPIVIGIWYIHTGFWGLLSATCGALLLLMNANLDFFSGLFLLNSPSSTYLWVLAVGMIGSSTIILIRNKVSTWFSIKTTAILVVALLLAFTPWAFKNIQEIDQLSITGIVQGRPSTHLIE